MDDTTEIPGSFPPEHYRAVGGAYFDRGHYERCVEVCRRGVAEHPDDGRLWELLGCSAWALGNIRPAREALEHATALVPLRVAAQLALAECYLNTESTAVAAVMLSALARPGKCPAEFLPRTAALLFKAGDYRRSANIWHRLRRAKPKWAEAHYRYALCLWARDVEPERLFEPLNEAVVLAPGQPRYALTLANVWSWIGDDKEAAASLSDVDPAQVRCCCCLRRMAAIFERVGDARCAAECHWRASLLTRPGTESQGDDTCGT